MFPEDLKAADPWGPHRDFGTVCHYHAQTSLGVVAPPEKYTDEIFLSARSCPGVPKTPAGFNARLEACVSKANSVVRTVTPLNPGAHWIAEYKAHDTAYLPKRKSRKGVPGYGGSVDLMMSDRSVLWDYKFIGKVPEYIKNEYVWQMVSYHLVTGVRKTGIIFTQRDASIVSYCVIDWADPAVALFVEMVRRFLKFVESPLFPKLAWAVVGDHCGFCKHQARCPLKRLPPIQTSIIEMSGAPNPLDALMKDHVAHTTTTNVPLALLGIPAIGAKPPSPPMRLLPPPPLASTTLRLPPPPPPGYGPPPAPPLVMIPATPTNDDPWRGILG